MTATEPRTAAGRRMLRVLADAHPEPRENREWERKQVLAIEAEAATPEATEAVRATITDIFDDLWTDFPGPVGDGFRGALAHARDRILATLAATPPAVPAALDVERLARFLVTITDDTDGDWRYPGSRRDLAREIVEYARLSSPEASDG